VVTNRCLVEVKGVWPAAVLWPDWGRGWRRLERWWGRRGPRAQCGRFPGWESAI